MIMPSVNTNIQRKSFVTRALSNHINNNNDVNKNQEETLYAKRDADLNGATGVSGRGLVRSKSKNLKRSNEELKSQVTRLKAEIELEKIKSKQTHRDKVAEVNRIKNSYERANHLSIETITKKMKNLNELEIKKLRDSLTRDKDLEIKQIIKYKDEEIRTLQKNMQDEINKLQHHNNRLQKHSSKTHSHINTEEKLKNDISILRRNKIDMEDKLKGYVVAVNQKNDMIKKLKEDHDHELQKILREARRENSRSVSEMQMLRKSIQEKEAEMNKLEFYASKLNEQKDELLKENKSPLKGSISVQDFQRLEQTTDLQSKNAELRRHLDSSIKRIKVLEKDNQTLLSNRTLSSVDTNNISREDGKIKELRRKNAELVAIARKLEEKVKQTQKEYNDYKHQHNQEKKKDVGKIKDEKIQLKKSYSIQRAQDLAKHANMILERDKKIEELRNNTSPPHNETVNDQSFNELQHEKDIAISELEELREIHSQCLSTKAQLESKTKKLEELSEDLQHKEEACHSLTMKLLQSEKDMKLARNGLEEGRILYHELKERFEMNKKDLKHAEMENTRMKNEILELDSLKAENVLIKEQLKTANQECEDLYNTVEELKEQIKILTKKLTELQEHINDLVMENTGVQQKLCERDEEILKFHKLQKELQSGFNNTLSDVQQELQNTRLKNEHLAQQMNKLMIKASEREQQKNSIEKQKQLVDHFVQTPSIDVRHKTTQTSDDFTSISRDSTQGRYSSDNVFDDDKTPPIMTNISATTPNVPYRLGPNKVETPKRSISTLENSELIDEDFSIQSENIMEIAASRINQLAVSASENETLSQSLNRHSTDDENSCTYQEVDEIPAEDFVHELDEYSISNDEDCDKLSLSDLRPNSNQYVLAAEKYDEYIDISRPNSNESCLTIKDNATDNNLLKPNSNQSEPIVTQPAKPCEPLSAAEINILPPCKNEIQNLPSLEKQTFTTESNDIVSPQLEPKHCISKTSTGNLNEIAKSQNAVFQGDENQDGIVMNDRHSSDEKENSLQELDTKEEIIDKKVERLVKNVPTAEEFKSMLNNLNLDEFPVKAFVAKYTYDPSMFSPNADHELELPFEVDTKVYVYGDADEDGFYIGELKCGRRGLVPSNLIEKLEDDYPINEELPFDMSDPDLSEAEASDSSTKIVIDQDNDTPLAAEYLEHTRLLRDQMEKPITTFMEDRDFILSLNTEVEGKEVPPPFDLRIERQLNNSVVIQWTSPQGIALKDIKGFTVYIDGKYQQTVLGSVRTKALVADIDTSKTCRISLRTITNEGKESRDDQAYLFMSNAKDTTNSMIPTTISEISSSKPPDQNDALAQFFDQIKALGQTSIEKRNSPRRASTDEEELIEYQSNLKDVKQTSDSNKNVQSHEIKLPSVASEKTSENNRDSAKQAHFNPENDRTAGIQLVTDEERIVISDDELSVIEEETEEEFPMTLNETTCAITRNKTSTDTVRTNSVNVDSGSLLDIVSENLLTSKTRTDEMQLDQKISTNQESQNDVTSRKSLTKDDDKMAVISESKDDVMTVTSELHNPMNDYKSSQETLMQVTDLSENISALNKLDNLTSIDKTSPNNKQIDQLISEIIESNPIMPATNEPYDSDEDLFEDSVEIETENIQNQSDESVIKRIEQDNEKKRNKLNRENTNLDHNNSKSMIEDSLMTADDDKDSNQLFVALESSIDSPLDASKVIPSKQSSHTAVNPVNQHHAKQLSVDENHNETYSVTSQHPVTTSTHNTDLRDASNNSISQPLNHPANTDSTWQLKSEELVAMLEKEAHRDILGDYPDLPLDNDDINEQKFKKKMITEDNIGQKSKTNIEIDSNDNEYVKDDRQFEEGNVRKYNLISLEEKKEAKKGIATSVETLKNETQEKPTEIFNQSTKIPTTDKVQSRPPRSGSSSTKVSPRITKKTTSASPRNSQQNSPILSRQCSIHSLKTVCISPSESDRNSPSNKLNSPKDSPSSQSNVTSSFEIISLTNQLCDKLQRSDSNTSADFVVSISLPSSKSEKRKTSAQNSKLESTIKNENKPEATLKNISFDSVTQSNVNETSESTSKNNSKRQSSVVSCESTDISTSSSMQNSPILPHKNLNHTMPLAAHSNQSSRNGSSPNNVANNSPKLSPKQSPKLSLKGKSSSTFISTKAENLSPRDFHGSASTNNITTEWSSKKLTDRTPENLHKTSGSSELSASVSSESPDIEEDSIERDMIISSLKASSVLTSVNVTSTVGEIPTDEENDDLVSGGHYSQNDSNVNSDLEGEKLTVARKLETSETSHLNEDASSIQSKHSTKCLNLNGQTSQKVINVENEEQRIPDVDDEYSEPIKINQPVKEMYSLASYDISSASEIPSDDDEFNVTPITALDDTGITDLSLSNKSDQIVMIPDVTSTLKKKEVRNQELKVQDEKLSPGEVPIKKIDRFQGDVGVAGTSKNCQEHDNILLENSIDDTDDLSIADSENLEEENFRIFIALFTYDPATMSPNIDFFDDELAFKKDDLIKVFGDKDEDGFYFGELNGKTGVIPGNMIAEINLDDNSLRTDEHNDSFDLTHMLGKDKNKKLKENEFTTMDEYYEHEDDKDELLLAVENLDKSLSASAPSIRNDNDFKSTPDNSIISETYLHASKSMPILQSSDNEEDESNLSFHSMNRIDPYKLQPRLMVALYDYDPAINSPNVDSEIELAFTSGSKIEIYGEMDEDGFFAGLLNGKKGLVPSNFIRDAADIIDKPPSFTTQLQSDNKDGKSSSGKTKIKKKDSFIKKSKKLLSKFKKK